MAGAHELVNNSFTLAQSYATEAKTQLASFADALNGAITAPPTVSVSWSSLAAPTLPTSPTAPHMPVISFDSGALGAVPNAFNEDAPEIEIGDFDEAAPELSLPIAPVVIYGAVPAIPAVGDVSVPAAPVLTMPAEPSYLELTTIAFSGVDLHEGWLDGLGDVPKLELAAPTPYSYTLGPEYSSELLSKLKAVLSTRMNGGTGIAPGVEQAIWARARDRETSIAFANEAEIMRSSEALGFPLPTGAIAAQLREAQGAYYDKLSGLSRDIAIKQADLEQENLKQTIASGMQLEGQLIDYSYKMEQLTFETAKLYAENAIQMHNVALEQFKTLLIGYQAYASVYKTIIDAQMAKVEVYKAQLQGEKTKAETNQVLVAQYKAAVEAGMAQVEIYRAQVGAAQTLVQLEQAKIGAAGEQIKAFVATVNAETSKVEAYKAQVQAEATKIEIYRTKAQVYSAKAGAQADRSRAYISRYQALTSAKSSEWDAYRARVGAESARIDALGRQSSALLEGYKAATASVQSQAVLQTTIWETSMKQYEAGIRVGQEAAKMNNDAMIQTNNARLDAAKAGTQVYAQLAASAYGMLNTSAGISYGSSLSVGYSYGGEVSGQPPALSFP